MSEQKYLISDTAKKLGIEPHVLRYWEDELELTIHRNEMGHRYYTDTDLRVLENVHKLKDQGFQLKALKMIVPEMYANKEFDLNHMLHRKEELNARAEQNGNVVGFTRPMGCIQGGVKGKNAASDMLSNEHKLAQFQEIMNQAVSQALKLQQQAIGEAVGSRMSEEVSERVSDKVLKQMDYLMRESDDHAEARFKKLDETIREVQKARMEAAATTGGKAKKGLFRKKDKPDKRTERKKK